MVNISALENSEANHLLVEINSNQVVNISAKHHSLKLTTQCQGRVEGSEVWHPIADNYYLYRMMA